MTQPRLSCKCMIKWIFFDLDGVLSTDKTGSVSACKYFSAVLNADFEALFDYVAAFDADIDLGKTSDEAVWRSAFAHFGSAGDFTAMLGAYLATPIDPVMLKLAAGLRSEYRVGIITDNSVCRARAIADKHAWDEIFDIIVISEAVKCTKRDAGIFNAAIRLAGAKPEECIFIDNSERNLVTAAKVGMHGIYFDDARRDYDRLRAELDNIFNENKNA